ncbi:uncharacterized protein METZ01_LOCUS163866 [marine metagenome]|uniref:Uncharacterized protein n=1 Tax=marine metagenome TaxID=408172 RepID=A0A382BCK1_9ZZZZ
MNSCYFLTSPLKGGGNITLSEV